MNKNQAAAYVNSQVACALIELESLKVANQEAEKQGLPRPYKELHIYNLIEKYGIHHNAVHDYLFINDRD